MTEFLTPPQRAAMFSMREVGSYVLGTKCIVRQIRTESGWECEYKEFGKLTWFRPIAKQDKPLESTIKTLSWTVAAELQNKGIVASRMDKSNHMMYLEFTELGRLTLARLEDHP